MRFSFGFKLMLTLRNRVKKEIRSKKWKCGKKQQWHRKNTLKMKV